MSAPQFDVIVYGATSFVGQILSQYLYDRHGADGASLRWAMAGRSQSKLEQVRSGLGAQASQIPLLTADAADAEALQRMVTQTKVIVSTVGPYALYGEPLVAACARSGTDYCDLTGEAQWIARMIERYAQDAEASGARIVHCCGFDSIPSDLGVAYVQQQCQQRFGAPAVQVKTRVKAMKGTFSGGTVASMLNAAKEVLGDPAVRKLMQNPYALCPKDQQSRTRQPNVTGPQFDADLQAWTAPFVMAAINTRVVHRSHALAGRPWGEDFLYDEAMLMGRGMAGRAAALGLSLGLGAFLAGAALPPTRWLMQKTFLPAPGEGPSPEQQRNGFWDYRVHARTRDGQSLVAKITGDRDPGYGSTAKMLGEAAACLALDISPQDVKGGFLTPATAMQDALRDRLIQHAGLSFEILP